MILSETVKYITVTYDLGSLADWISAFATFLAVVVSLYLANRRDLPKIHFSILRKDDSIRITNKSYQIVELMVKTDNDKKYLKIGLPPLKKDNPNMRDEEPFNHDMITLRINGKGKAVHHIKAYDLITNARYRAIYFLKDGEWVIKQYKLFHIWKWAI